MDISHLYHDATFGDPTIQLDVKEQIRTREFNAREERNLDRVSRSLERAKGICEKTTTWERWKLGQNLQSIWERTPHLEKSLAVEKARVASLQRSLLAGELNRKHEGEEGEVIEPAAETSLPPPAPSEVSELPRRHDHRRGHRRHKSRKRREEPSDGIVLNTNVGVLERHIHKPADFVRRSEHVVKALAKLNCRQETRRLDHLRFKEELEEFSKPIIDKAKVILKGRTDVGVDQLFQELDEFFTADRDDVTRSMDSLLTGSRDSFGGSQRLVLTERNLQKHELQTDIEPTEPFYLPQITSTSCFDLRTVDQEDQNDNEIVEDTSRDDCAQNVQGDNVDDSYENMTSANKEDFDFAVEPSPANRDNHVVDDDKSKSFHLPLIQNRMSDDGVTGHRSVVSSREFRESKSKRSSNQFLRNNKKDMYSPSTTVSQVIFEEDENAVNANGFPDIYSTNVRNHFDYSSAKNDYQEDDESKYALPCTMGLPQLWKQPPKQQKEKPQQEISPAAIARKHRRRRVTNQNKW